MKARNLLWISVVNIFLLLLVSVIMEYSDLNSRFKQLQNTFSTAVETSIRASTASEELFSEKFAATTSSFGTNSSGDLLSGGIRVLSSNGGSWVSGSNYVMSYFYHEHNRFPKTQHEYNAFKNTVTDTTIYSWLFGNVGSVYNKYAWANSRTKLWNSIRWNGISTDRQPTANFKQFYDNIGKYITTDAYVKSQVAGGSFKIETKTIPTLTQMGLQLDESWNGNASGGSSYTNDYLSSVIHFGKAYNGIADTSYFLTPYSLGVTYVPVEVFKPVFLSHLEQLVRFNKVKHTVTSDGDLTDFRSANGCISTEVYNGSTNEVHTDVASTNIINDGKIEYDLSTAKVKVDYFLVDFYNNSNYLIVNRIEGSTSQYSASGGLSVDSSNLLTNLPSRLRDKDTSTAKNGNRIVAKVSVKMKVHIPYKSSILQWFRHLNDTDGSNHYDIRLWDDGNDAVDFNSNGVWFYYTTYTAISR